MKYRIGLFFSVEIVCSSLVSYFRINSKPSSDSCYTKSSDYSMVSFGSFMVNSNTIKNYFFIQKGNKLKKFYQGNRIELTNYTCGAPISSIGVELEITGIIEYDCGISMYELQEVNHQDRPSGNTFQLSDSDINKFARKV